MDLLNPVLRTSRTVHICIYSYIVSLCVYSVVSLLYLFLSFSICLRLPSLSLSSFLRFKHTHTLSFALFLILSTCSEQEILREEVRSHEMVRAKMSENMRELEAELRSLKQKMSDKETDGEEVHFLDNTFCG